MLRLQLVLIFTVAIAILATVFAISSFGIYSSDTSYDDDSKGKRIFNTSVIDDGRKATMVNTAHGVYQTTGDILDPTSQVTTRDNIVVDPMEYLRAFNYGRISSLPNGTILREFTLIAS